jgi:hypothetical protein
MKKYTIGNVYTFLADDEAHAVEQYLDAVTGLDAVEVNYIVLMTGGE